MAIRVDRECSAGYSDSNRKDPAVEQLLSISIFFAFALMFVLGTLIVGAIVRPKAPTPEKLRIYECGEPVIGSGWVQFDLRFYVVALFYLVFDVEVALIYPWAVVFREAALTVLIIGAPFLAVIIIGFAYEWYSGSLDWVRSSVTTSMAAGGKSGKNTFRDIARIDPELMQKKSN